MATKVEKLADKLNSDFRDKIIVAMREKFDLNVENNFSIFDMRLHTTRTDGQDFTTEQHAYLDGFSTGFGEAMDLIRTGL